MCKHGSFIYFLCSFTFTIAAASVADVWYVDKANGSGVENGTSWASAFTTIQPAIDAAFADGGGEVWIAQGTYGELRASLFFDPLIDIGALALKEGVSIFGGFEGIETSREERDWLQNATIIDGSMSRGGESAFTVILGANSSVLDGFTIMGGRGTGRLNFGGGLFTPNTSMTIRNCKFVGNEAHSGGAIGNEAGTLIIDDCEFFNNKALRFTGGAVAGDGNITFSGCPLPRILQSIRAVHFP